MKAVIVLIITFFLLGCNSQKSVCRYNIANENNDMSSCKGAIINVLLISDGDSWILQALATCLTAIRKEAECNKKSEYIPAIGQGK